MDSPISRRSFLHWLGSSFLALSGIERLSASEHLDFDAPAPPLPPPPVWAEGYGDLIADKAALFNLPKGFKYKIIARTGDKMADGLLRPGRPDGMAAFPCPSSPDKLLLVCNHENSAHQVDMGAFGTDNALLRKVAKAKFYDYGYGKQPHLGGTSTLVYNEKNQKLERQFLSLAGTSRNCAGGTTPWGTWLTCEEDIKWKDDKNEQRHGYVFEVNPTETATLTPPVALKGMGRFNHEAAVVDPKSGIIYLTEDRNDALFYRYIPKVRGQLAKGGKLQALAFVYKSKMDTRNWETNSIRPRVPYAVRWIDLKDVDGQHDDLRIRGYKMGAAVFARGEGAWCDGKHIYIACTSGGKQQIGQIFRYSPSPYEGTAKETNNAYRPRLTLFAESTNPKQLRYCDNLTIAPWGDIVFVEDSRSQARIMGITQDGQFYRIGENIGKGSELAGVCFSPSGKTLFVNVQDVGLTLAITGDWKSRKTE